MPTRRQCLSLLAAAATGSIAGCQQVLEGGKIDAVAEPAQASSNAVSQTEFTHLETIPQSIEGNVTVIGGEWDINIKWWTAAYGTYDTDVQEQIEEGDIDPPEGSERAFLIMSSPDAEHDGTKYNPVHDYTTEEIAALAPAGDDNTEIENVENIGQSEVTIFDQETTADIFRATVTQTTDSTKNETEISPHNESGEIGTIEESDVIVTASRITHQEDILFFIGYYAEEGNREGPDPETQEHFLSLIESVEHPVDVETENEQDESDRGNTTPE